MVNRLPAKKVRIADIVTGKYFAGSKDDMKPSYVIMQLGEKVSRVNLVATAVDKFESEDGNYASLSLDDGSGGLRVKAFKDVTAIKNIELGDMVLVIGKLKEYQGEVYINLEIAKKVEPNYEIKHKLEVLRNLIGQKKFANEIRKLASHMSEEELENYVQTYGMDEESVKVILSASLIDYKPKVLQLLQELDKGSGVEVSKLFEILSLPEDAVENVLTELLDEGYIFEPFPGKLKRI